MEAKAQEDRINLFFKKLKSAYDFHINRNDEFVRIPLGLPKNKLVRFDPQSIDKICLNYETDFSYALKSIFQNHL
jgi:hypothetical protein